MTEQARLETLQAELHRCLRAAADEVYAPLLACGVVKPQEVADELERYYLSKRPGLQTVYSFYAEQWDCYHQAHSASPGELISLLGRLRGTFSRTYSPYELDADYYLQRLRAGNPASEEWRQLRALFEERWHALLSAREEDYRQSHISRLCAEYYRMIAPTADRLNNSGRVGSGGATRLSWLQALQEPALRKALDELLDIVRRNPIVADIDRRLGREHAASEARFRAVADRRAAQRVRSASASDIVGVRTGNDLGALLPGEYAVMADEALHPLFLKRYTEQALQLFDSASHVAEKGRATGAKGTDAASDSGRGPFVVCVDTSASMSGMREKVAKAIVLGLALLAERCGRRCRVVLFSDQMETVEFADLYEGLPRLTDFLCRSFHGGTDLTPALDEAVAALRGEEFLFADLLVLSDFDLPPLDELRRAVLLELKARQVGCYAVTFGEAAHDFVADVADHSWIYR